jgi:hypothetical protein
MRRCVKTLPVPDLAVAHCCPGNVRVLFAAAPFERIAMKGRNTVRYDNRNKVISLSKRTVGNSGNTVRNDDRSKAAARKRKFANADDTVRYNDRFKVYAMVERTLLNGGNTVRYDNRNKLTLVKRTGFDSGKTVAKHN